MAREVVVRVTCDWCGQSVTEDQAVNVVWSIGSEPFEIDFCSKCLPELENRSRPTTIGRAKRKPANGKSNGRATVVEIDAGRRPMRDVNCPYCDDPRTFKPPGLKLHIKASHPAAMDEADYEDRMLGLRGVDDQ